MRAREIVGIVAALVVVGSCVALLAGALLPWRGTGAGDQLTTIAAFAAIAIAASLAVGLVAPRLVSLGVPDAVVVMRDLRRVPCGRARCARPPARGRRLMIAATDIVTLAPGVDVRQELLRDAVRGHAWPLNASGAFVLARAGRPLGAVASELADAFSLPRPRREATWCDSSGSSTASRS